MPSRNAEPVDPRARFSLYRLCECPECEGRGKTFVRKNVAPVVDAYERCPECRGEGRVRQELATCESPEAVGVALVTLARESEFEECPLGLLDRMAGEESAVGKWLIRPWMPSARNVSDAARTLARSKKPS